MNRRAFSALVVHGACLIVLAGCGRLGFAAPTPAAARRIGFLSADARADTAASSDAFLDQLRQLGWTVGPDFAVEWRFAEGHVDLLPELASSLAQVPVELIFAVDGDASFAAQQQTRTIPIVANGVNTDPTSLGSIDTLARPGRNVTGTTYSGTTATVSVKSVELLKGVLPNLLRLAILYRPLNTPATPNTQFATDTASRLGVQTLALAVQSAEEVDRAFGMAQKWGAEAVLLSTQPSFSAGVNARVIEQASTFRLPVMYQYGPLVTRSGALMSFSTDLTALYREGATYVDKILRGANPADLPVENPTQYEFIVNVSTARALGITFPADVAVQVTEWV
jgi:putative ABC transport system substrate-binding protein